MKKMKRTTQNCPFPPESILDTQQRFVLLLSTTFKNTYSLKDIED